MNESIGGTRDADDLRRQFQHNEKKRKCSQLHRNAYRLQQDKRAQTTSAAWDLPFRIDHKAYKHRDLHTGYGKKYRISPKYPAQFELAWAIELGKQEPLLPPTIQFFETQQLRVRPLRQSQILNGRA